mmetsp:Transcript_1227/g.1572  ORF Transcript_1227/g.1572 Transcript_1227/m.1572 type:complete len:274 (-) Transcript_1227:64-885(-)
MNSKQTELPPIDLHESKVSVPARKSKKRNRKKHEAGCLIQQNQGLIAAGIGRKNRNNGFNMIPDLSHIGIRTAYSTEREDAVVYPDGYISQSLKNSIAKTWKSLPHVPIKDQKDVLRRDYDKICQKFKIENPSIRRFRSESVDAEIGSITSTIDDTDFPNTEYIDSSAEEMYDIDRTREGSLNSLTSYASIISVGSRRSKEPYSAKTMMNCLLDLEYSSMEDHQNSVNSWNTESFPIVKERENSLSQSQTNPKSLRLAQNKTIAYGQKLYLAK